jgi:hypothetical protein
VSIGHTLYGSADMGIYIYNIKIHVNNMSELLLMTKGVQYKFTRMNHGKKEGIQRDVDVELFDDKVVISGSPYGGLGSMLSKQKISSELLLSSINTVTFQEATTFLPGFVLLGSIDSKSLNFQDVKFDPNAILFGKKYNEDYIKLRDEVKNRININDVKSHTTIQNSSSDLDELQKLANLKEKGIISQEEFDKKKAQILNL